MKDQKILVIGTGTGRCGTTTLSKLCGLQDGVSATHEMLAGMPFDQTDGYKLSRVEEFLHRAFAHSNKAVDVSSAWWSYLPQLRAKCAEQDIRLHIVWLTRNRHQFVKSSMRWCRRTNIYLTPTPWCGRLAATRGWQNAFPNFDMVEHEGTAAHYGRWWDICWHAKHVASKEHGAILIGTEQLNGEGFMGTLLTRLLDLDTFRWEEIVANRSLDGLPNIVQSPRDPPEKLGGVRAYALGYIGAGDLRAASEWVKLYGEWCSPTDMRVCIVEPDGTAPGEMSKAYHKTAIHLLLMGVKITRTVNAIYPDCRAEEGHLAALMFYDWQNGMSIPEGCAVLRQIKGSAPFVTFVDSNPGVHSHIGMHITESGAWVGATRDDHQISEELSRAICDFCVEFGIDDLYDFGCGTGEYMKVIAEGGTLCAGVEGDPAMVGEDVYLRDLGQEFYLGRRADCVLSLEVGEHIPPGNADAFLDNIVRHAEGWVILSWALPDQHGAGHVNCRTNEWVKEQMTKRGCTYLHGLTERLRSAITPGCWTDYFKRTVMVFSK